MVNIYKSVFVNLFTQLCNVISKPALQKFFEGGPPPKISNTLLRVMSTHCTMKQVSGKGEAKPKHIRSVLYAAVKNTSHESIAKIENIYRKVLTTQVDGMINSSQLDVEDIRMQWTTYEKNESMAQ